MDWKIKYKFPKGECSSDNCKVFKKSYLKDVDIVFTALPNGEAQEISKHLLKNNKLIDLAAEFRLSNPKEYNYIMMSPNCKNENISEYREIIMIYIGN